MVKVKITEKPGIWPYVLLNDFKSPPYFAYEIVDDNGNRNFVRVLKGAPEKLCEPKQIRHNVKLTAKRKLKISQFLRETLKKPFKYGEFLSKEWIHKLVEHLGLSNQQTIEVVEKIVEENWLKRKCFENLIQAVRKGPVPGDDAENESVTIRVSGKIENQPLSSSAGSRMLTRGLKRRQSASKKNDTSDDDDDEDSSDDDLFTPFIVLRKKKKVEEEVVCENKVGRQADEK